ncbi:MAG: PPOX class F420-dependent oxidoreductase [Dietzia sp.]|nr:PPOX class F420-dependent oxidoreductase [Dietzia sp.]
MPDQSPTTEELARRVGEAKFVSLVTYKRDGSAVGAPMWVARDGADLVMWTPTDTWKVKRARRDPRVVLIRSGRVGKVDPVEPCLLGTVVVEDAPETVAKVEQLMRRKYGLEFVLVTTIEAVVSRGRKPRVVLRIAPQQVDSKGG